MEIIYYVHGILHMIMHLNVLADGKMLNLTRAIKSAKLAFPEFEIIADSRLRECNYGVLDGKNKKLVNYEEHIIKPFFNGESLIDVEKRVRDFLGFLKEKYSNKTVGIIAHRAPQLALEVIINKISWEEAIKNDWRKTGNWAPGWKYMLE